MEEPLGALDRRLREAMQSEILRLSREMGLTVINVTHDQEEAFTMSDKIALLAGGSLVQYASPEEIYTRPVSSVAAEFLGEANMFRGVLTRSSRGELQLPVGSGRIVVSPECWIGSAPDAGHEVALVVRPWAVDIQSARAGGLDTPPAADCWLAGRLAAVIYAGDSQKLVVERPDETELIVRRPMENKFVAEPGAEVFVTWAHQNAVVTQVG
jgi:putative spermidine/putrescine transport system ATP-binding protein